MLFFFYLLLFCWLLSKLNLVACLDIKSKYIIFLFIARVISGIINGYFDLYYFIISDSKWFHIRGLEEYHLLIGNPLAYISTSFKRTGDGSFISFFSTTHSYWNNLKDSLMIKFLSILNIFSFGNYFTNVLIYNFLIFISSIFLYKLFITKFPGKKWVLILSIFLLPDFIFFTSAIHKEGLMFIALTIILYQFDRLTMIKTKSIINIAILCLALLFILIVRNYIFLLLIPGLIAWYISTKIKRSSVTIFIWTYLICIVFFFLSGYLTNHQLDLPKLMIERQSNFSKLSETANTSLPTLNMQPTIQSFIINLPDAIVRSFFGTFISKRFSFSMILFSLDSLVFLLTLILCLVFKYKNLKSHPIFLFLIFFSISMFLTIGYTVTNVGAIIRYRSLFYAFMIIPMGLFIDWGRIKTLYRK